MLLCIIYIPVFIQYMPYTDTKNTFHKTYHNTCFEYSKQYSWIWRHRKPVLGCGHSLSLLQKPRQSWFESWCRSLDVPSSSIAANIISCPLLNCKHYVPAKRWEILPAKRWRISKNLPPYRRDFPRPISLLLGQYSCWIAENIIATVTDSSQLKKNNELMKYIKNSDCSTAPGS